jgi:hypothetical protein
VCTENQIRTSAVFRKDSPKVLGVEHQQMVRALAPDRADQAFNVSVLPRGMLIAIMQRSCSDSLLTASQSDGVFGSDMPHPQ